MRFYNLHAPDQVRLFHVPAGSIRRWDEEVLVYDVRVAADRVLRHYSFYRRWFEVNCSLDLQGRFVIEPGPVEWSFNCDICTPLFTQGDAAYDFDLWLDVLVGPDGRTHAVIDEDDFAKAVRLGWCTPDEEAGARRGLADLLAVIEGEGLVPFLERYCRFGPVDGAPVQPRFERLPLAEVTPLQLPQRERLRGCGAR
jgi:hypothetical protein